MSISVGNRVRVTAHMKLIGLIDVENVFDLHVDTGGTGNDQDFMSDMADWLDTAYQELVGDLHPGLLFQTVDGFNVSAKEPLPSLPWPSLHGGTSGGDLMATGVALVTLFHTLKSRVIGRKFIGGLTETALVGGNWASGVVSNAVSWTLLIAAGPTMTTWGGTVSFVIYDKLGVPRLPIRFVANGTPAYQRRRRAGVGS